MEVPLRPSMVDAMIGHTYGELSVTGWIWVTGNDSSRARYAVCDCSCGNTGVTIYPRNIKSGASRSCGHCRQSTHPMYKVWSHMMDRCYKVGSKDYPNWGGRGIRVCEEWHDPRAFIAYVERELGPRPDGYTFDRIYNNGDYAPGNVRWAPRLVQSVNRRGKTSGASSQYKGVSHYVPMKDGHPNGRPKWQANIRLDGKLHRLGNYDEEIEAAMVYDLAALSAWGDDAVVNFTSSRN